MAIGIEWFGTALDNLIEAVIILLVGFIIARVAGRLLGKIVRETEIRSISKRTGIHLDTAKYADIVVEYLIYFVTIIIALDRLGLATIMVYAALGVVSLLIVLAIFFGLKDLVPNAFAGLVLWRKRLFGVGDLVRISEVAGRVRKKGLLETSIETVKKDVIHVPNFFILKSKIVVLKKARY